MATPKAPQLPTEAAPPRQQFRVVKDGRFVSRLRQKFPYTEALEYSGPAGALVFTKARALRVAKKNGGRALGVETPEQP